MYPDPCPGDRRFDWRFGRGRSLGDEGVEVKDAVNGDGGLGWGNGATGQFAGFDSARGTSGDGAGLLDKPRWDDARALNQPEGKP